MGLVGEIRDRPELGVVDAEVRERRAEWNSLRVVGDAAIAGWLRAVNDVGAVAGTLLYIPARFRLRKSGFLIFVICFAIVVLSRFTT